MKKLLSLFAVLVLGCSQQEQPTAALTVPTATQQHALIQSLDAGSECAAGGVQVIDTDGTVASICNGLNGSVGPQGPVGPVGQQGSVGPRGPVLVLGQADGGEIGILSGQDIYIEDANCYGRANWRKGQVEAVASDIKFDGLNCTGTAFVAYSSNAESTYPFGCYSPEEGRAWVVAQPFEQTTVTWKSVLSTGVLGDGGIGAVCTNTTNTHYAFQVNEIPLAVRQGPFTFGKR